MSISEKKLCTQNDLIKMGLASKKSLQTWRAHSTGPKFIRLHTGQVRYALKDIEEWLQQHTSLTQSEGC